MRSNFPRASMVSRSADGMTASCPVHVPDSADIMRFAAAAAPAAPGNTMTMNSSCPASVGSSIFEGSPLGCVVRCGSQQRSTGREPSSIALVHVESSACAALA